MMRKPSGGSTSAFMERWEEKKKKDRFKADIRKDVKEYGWLCMNVYPNLPHQCEFSYSIGFYETFKLPEVIVFGLDKAVAHGFLREVFNLYSDGKDVPVNTRVEDIANNDYSVIFHEVSKEHYLEFFGNACTHYGSTDFPVLLLSLPDKNNVFPWESGYQGQMPKDPFEVFGDDDFL